jgi:hypothetical protein
MCVSSCRGSHRLPTAAARVRAQVKSCGVYGGQSGTGAGFLRVLGFFLPIVPHLSSSGAGKIGQPVMASVIVDSVPLYWHPPDEVLWDQVSGVYSLLPPFPALLTSGFDVHGTGF